MSEKNEENIPPIENAFAGIVITAQTFNPSIFTESWLVQNKIVQADAFTGLRLFSPEISQFQTALLQVSIIPPKMQTIFNIKQNPVDISIPIQFSAKVVELLPHTPYTGIGLNFDYFLAPPKGKDFFSFNRELFGKGDCKLLQEFSAPDTKYGRYFSKQYGDSRLKLDIKPVQAGEEKKDLLQWSFNFHYDISQLTQDLRAKKAVEFINTFEALKKYSESILSFGTVP